MWAGVADPRTAPLERALNILCLSGTFFQNEEQCRIERITAEAFSIYRQTAGQRRIDFETHDDLAR